MAFPELLSPDSLATVMGSRSLRLLGDVVSCTVPRNLAHIMIVSDRRSTDGTPLVSHNIGRGTKEEARLFEFHLTGHYRIPAE